MNSYLGLVFAYAKAHKKKNRLTVICIALSVMLVTAIFGMADMSLLAQKNETLDRYGNWHYIIDDISDETAKKIQNQSNVSMGDWLGIITDDITYQGKELIVQSCSQDFAQQMNLTVLEGTYPVAVNEAMMDADGLTQYGLSIGSTIDVSFQDGQTREYKITGTFGDFSSLKGDDAHGLDLSREGMHALPDHLYRESFYLRFHNGVNIREAISELKETYGLSDEQFQENVMLLGLTGQSDDGWMLSVYLTAVILFILVAMAGSFMIASSFNMSILERSQFFGMLRCLGATKKQIKRYIRLEGLQYCAKAIPIGLVSGCMLLWGAIFVLNALNTRYFPLIPMFQISIPGIAAGIILGFFVVMLASSSSAKKAAAVSPQAAVTGNSSQPDHAPFRKAINPRLFHVDTAMGLHHAFSNKKSMVLIAGSFAISIVLFLCFSILITIMNHALTPLKPYSPEMSVEGLDDTVLLPASLKEEIAAIAGVDNAFGRMFYFDVPARDQHSSNMATLISYDETQFAWVDELLISGSIEQVQTGPALLANYNDAKAQGWQTGDIITLTIAGVPHQLPIAAIVSDVPFDTSNGEWIVICSEQTFTALTGISEYRIIDVQASTDVSASIRSLIASDMKLLDYQKRNDEVQNGYLAMAVFVYGFLLVIAFVAFINIINTVNASISSRMNHYGVMRAVGMSGIQLKKVVRAEAAAYALTGCITGGLLGVILHRFLFVRLVTPMWGEQWKPPLVLLAVIIGASMITTLLAVLIPAKKVEQTSIINVVNASQ